VNVAPVAVVVDEAGASAWSGYYAEVLAHLGVAFDPVSPSQLADRLGDYRLLLFPSVPALPAQLTGLIGDWVRAGGALLLAGDPGGLGDIAGAEAVGPLTDGLVTVDRAPAWGSGLPGLRAFGGVRLALAGADSAARWDSGEPAIATRRADAGVVITFGVDVWQTIVRIQQGWAVTGDGPPAPDGTAPIDDDILKCEDGLALSYADRAVAPGAEFREPFEHVYPPASAAPFFDRPHADLWRFLFARALFWAADTVDVPLPCLFYWPVGVPAIGHMSHDSDGNTDEAGRAALAAFAAADVNVTWCVLHPGGYSPDIYREIAAAGHEIALHYNAMGDTDLDTWGFEFMQAQCEWLRKTTGIDQIVSNKNHYTRWEGFDDFYLWCERLGIQTDQSRGPSKQGTVGFPFGTAHPSFPISNDGRLIDVLELPLHTQDLWWTAVVPDRQVILEQALAVHGVAHFLFHGRNMVPHPEISAVVPETVEAGRALGMPWWTSAQINDWERRRRGVRVTAARSGDEVEVEVISATAVSEAAILLTIGPGAVLVGGAGVLRSVTRHGREFVELGTDLPAGRSIYRIRLA